MWNTQAEASDSESEGRCAGRPCGHRVQKGKSSEEPCSQFTDLKMDRVLASPAGWSIMLHLL